jgi:hypothetical protein
MRAWYDGIRAPVAQWTERGRPKACVGGSSPFGGAMTTLIRAIGTRQHEGNRRAVLTYPPRAADQSGALECTREGRLRSVVDGTKESIVKDIVGAVGLVMVWRLLRPRPAPPPETRVVMVPWPVPAPTPAGLHR